MEYRYKVLDWSAYDGDSFELTLDLGFGMSLHKKCRIYGIDTPELRGGTVQSKAAGYLARDKARDYVAKGMENPDIEVIFESTGYAGKFGRPLGNIVLAHTIGDTVVTDNLVDFLLNARLGVRYHGQAKREIQAEHDANIAWLQEQGLI